MMISSGMPSTTSKPCETEAMASSQRPPRESRKVSRICAWAVWPMSRRPEAVSFVIPTHGRVEVLVAKVRKNRFEQGQGLAGALVVDVFEGLAKRLQELYERIDVGHHHEPPKERLEVLDPLGPGGRERFGALSFAFRPRQDQLLIFDDVGQLETRINPCRF